VVCAVPLESERENECAKRDREGGGARRVVPSSSTSLPPPSRSTLLLATAPRRVASRLAPSFGGFLFCLCFSARGGGGGAARPTPGRIQRGVSRLRRGILYYDDQWHVRICPLPAAAADDPVHRERWVFVRSFLPLRYSGARPSFRAGYATCSRVRCVRGTRARARARACALVRFSWVIVLSRREPARRVSLPSEIACGRAKIASTHDMFAVGFWILYRYAAWEK